MIREEAARTDAQNDPPHPSIAVAVCTHNPRPAALTRVIDAIAAQTDTPDEVIVVDNASAPPVDVGVRTVREDAIGLVHARVRALHETTADVVVFVDDDNVIEPTYIAASRSIGVDWPNLGCWGAARVLPEYERPPADDVAPALYLLGVRDDPDGWALLRKGTGLEAAAAIPIGAGVCVRREVLAAWAARVERDPLRRELGVRGADLARCEDLDLALTAPDLNLGVAVFRTLGLRHLIPVERTQPDYLLKLVEGHEYSMVLLRAVRGAIERDSPGRRVRSARVLLRARGFERSHHLASRRGFRRATRILTGLEGTKAT
jgi:hypothetical protein